MTDFELQIANILKDPRLTENQRSILLDLDAELRLELGVKTRRSYHWVLRNLAVFLGDKSFKEAKKRDLERFFNESLTDLSSGSQALVRSKVKRFYKWLYSGNLKGRKYPLVVEWISTTRKNNNRSKEISEVLAPDKILRLVERSYTPRDKALIVTFWESATRPLEFLNLNIRDLDFDEYGCLLTIHGEDSVRRIRLVLAVPYLKNWINHHPLTNISIAPLWINLRTKKRLTYSGFYLMLQRLKDWSLNKSLSPNLFRQSRLNHLSHFLTESELKIYAGINKKSQLSMIYPDVDKAVLDSKIIKIGGLETQMHFSKRDEFSVLKGLLHKECFQCRKSNPIDAKYCCDCGSILEESDFSSS